MIVIIFCSVILFYLYVYFGKIKEIFVHVQLLKKLPQKKGYPIVGHALEFIGTPDAVFRKLEAYVKEYAVNGVVCVWLLFLPLILITEPDIIEKIVKSQRHLEKGSIYDVVRPWLNDGLLTSTGAKWHIRRRILTPAFHFKILQRFFNRINEESGVVVQNLKGSSNDEVNVTSFVSKFTLNSICETAMGTNLNEESEEGEKYRSAVHEFGILSVERVYKTWLLVDQIFRLTKHYSKQMKTLNILHAFSKKVIDKRKNTIINHEEISMDQDETIYSNGKKMAMLDLLLSAQLNGENIDDEGIREEVDTFVFEGHDTTAVSLSFTLMLLANNSDCQEKVYRELESILGDDSRDLTYKDIQEMKYLECCIKESLRLYPSVPKIARKLEEDIVLDNGNILPKGLDVMIMIYDMHRKAELFPNPEKFDPDRFLLENFAGKHPYAYLPFSAGPRNCIGQKFAMMEMKCFLAAVLRKYILEPIDTPGDIECMMDLVLRTKDPIRVKFVPRVN